MLDCIHTILHPHPRESLDNPDAFDAKVNDGEEEAQDVGGVVVFAGPVVGVVEEAGVFVGFDLIAFENPFDGAFAVDDVVVSDERNVFERDMTVVDDLRFVFLGCEAHFVYAEGGFGDVVHGGDLSIEDDLRGIAAGFRSIVFYSFICNEGIRGRGVPVSGSGCFGGEVIIMEMEFGEGLTRFAEGHEVVEAFDDGDAREFLFEIGGEGFAVVLSVEETVDVVENVFLGDGAGIRETAADFLQHPIRDAVMADVARVVVECGELVALGFFVPIKRETLGRCV